MMDQQSSSDNDVFKENENSVHESSDELEYDSDKEEEKWKEHNENLKGLDAIKVCINENEDEDEEFLSKKLNLSISTWMQIYESNLDDMENLLDLREAVIEIVNKLRNCTVTVNEHGSFISKFESTAPYNFFLTTVNDQKSTFNEPFSVSLHELLDYKLGTIVDSLHFSFILELSWIVTEYMLAAQNPKMTILYESLMDPDYEHDIPFDVELVKVEMPDFSCFHSKISILKYEDNKVRIVISTANLFALDWQTSTQGVWVSPILPPLPIDADDNDGESVTNFKADFIEYLSNYKQPEVFGWIALLYRTDFSSIKVYFLGSVPGNHKNSKLYSWGYNKLDKILSSNIVLPENEKEWVVVAQSSAVGSYGSDYSKWIKYIINSMSREKNKKIIFLPDFKYIYPTKNNYICSYDCKVNRVILNYSLNLHSKQKWIKNHMCQWKYDKTGRSLAIPHLKTYTRLSPDLTEIPWFVLTSANFSKGAWGTAYPFDDCLTIRNFEAGVVFIPQVMINQNTFPIKESTCTDAPVFLLPYDVPLTVYNDDDEPFFSDLEDKTKEQVDECT